MSFLLQDYGLFELLTLTPAFDAKDRLNERIGKRIGGRQQGGRFHVDSEGRGNLRDDGINRPRKQRRGENDKSDNFENGRDGSTHFREVLASRSKAVSVRSNSAISLSGTMFGPSEGA